MQPNIPLADFLGFSLPYFLSRSSKSKSKLDIAIPLFNLDLKLELLNASYYTKNADFPLPTAPLTAGSAELELRVRIILGVR